jgi:hypothetical protein
MNYLLEEEHVWIPFFLFAFLAVIYRKPFVIYRKPK